MSSGLGFIGTKNSARPPPCDPYWNNTVAYIAMTGVDGSDFYPDSTALHSWTALNAFISSSTSVFGGGSATFSGSGGVISSPDSADWAFPGDFTFEIFAKPTAVDASRILFTLSNGDGIGWYIDGAFPTYYRKNVANILASSVPMVAGVWQHVALSRTSGVSKIYVGGVLGGTIADNFSYVSGSPMTVGNDGGGNRYLGSFNYMRITKGVGRYPASFTPPSAPYPTIQCP